MGRKHSVVKSGLLIVFLITISGILDKYKDIPSFDQYKIVAHGLGAIDSKQVTNTLEAFESNYQKGTRLFEADLIETSDGHIVARHDWMLYLYDFLGQKHNEANGDLPLSLEEFKNLPIHDKYTPVTFEDLLDLMIKYPDIYLITDTKTTTKEDTSKVFSKIVNIVTSKDSSLINRIFPQVYNEENYNGLMEVYPFASQNILYTLYYETKTPEECLRFAIKNNFKGIVVSDYLYSQNLAHQAEQAGINVYVHTINKLSDVKRYLNDYVDAVYSDYVTESMLKN